MGRRIQNAAGETVAELMGALPHATNNVAEYNGLLAALDWCAEHGATIVAIRSDSLLLVQQMRGVYKVKHEGLKPLHGRARLLAHKSAASRSITSPARRTRTPTGWPTGRSTRRTSSRPVELVIDDR